MPELPEVEVVRRQLAAGVAGRRIERVEVGRERTVRRTSAGAVIAGLTGTTVLRAERRGKYLICPLDSGDALMVHLRMSGQLRLDAPATPRPAHTHVAMALSDGQELRFVDPRTFGEVVVFDPDRLAIEVPELARLGPDPVADPFGRRRFERVVGRPRQIKALLLDQHAVAGLGNIYTDEVLHRARVRYDRRADSLTPREVGALHRAIGTVLAAAIGAGGSTLGDDQYVGLAGESGSFQHEHRVYGRAGAPCRRCGRRSTIVRVPFGGRSTFFCPRCQR